MTDKIIYEDKEAEDAKKIVEIAVRALDDKKASDIKILRVHDNTVLADYFIICTGNNTTQIKTLAGEAEFKLEEAGFEKRGIEGLHEASWVILDYGCVIIHVFKKDTRNFYGLERLWAESEDIDISAFLPENE